MSAVRISMKKRIALLAVALVGAAMVVLPAPRAAQAVIYGVSGTLNTQGYITHYSTFRAHSSLVRMTFLPSDICGAPFQLWLRNAAGTNVTDRPSITQVGSAGRVYWNTPGGSSVVPSGSFTFSGLLVPQTTENRWAGSATM